MVSLKYLIIRKLKKLRLNYFSKELIMPLKLCCLILFAIALLYFAFKKTENTKQPPEIIKEQKQTFNETKKCLEKTFKEISNVDYDLFWLTFDEKVNNCTYNFTQQLPIHEFYNDDEIKYGILPSNNESDCNAVTLGIGRDVRSEKELLRKFRKCKFLGVDPDAERSGRLYKTLLNGTFIQGLVGATKGNYKALVLDDMNYKPDNFSHYSFQDLLTKYYKHDIIDFLFMDIEGDEFALMHELIQNPEKYPIICQINVEFHNPYPEERGAKFFVDFYKSFKNGQYFPLKAETKTQYFFNRIFFVNLKDVCIKKFFEMFSV